jgi:hypothetical protein
MRLIFARSVLRDSNIGQTEFRAVAKEAFRSHVGHLREGSSRTCSHIAHSKSSPGSMTLNTASTLFGLDTRE